MARERFVPGREALVIYNSQETSRSSKRIGRVLLPILLTFAGASAIVAQDPQAQVRPASQQVTRDSERTTDSHRQTTILQPRNRHYRLHSADMRALAFPFTSEFNQSSTLQQHD